MRKIQKILLGSFLTGVLICGVGAGTAIGEYGRENPWRRETGNREF